MILFVNILLSILFCVRLKIASVLLFQEQKVGFRVWFWQIDSGWIEFRRLLVWCFSELVVPIIYMLQWFEYNFHHALELSKMIRENAEPFHFIPKST